uniref:ISXO2-like transposase domain-containing protein n=1 Tax=Globodera rostochiensis TaxID=31243 RepID=A0A914HPR6_GLORO
MALNYDSLIAQVPDENSAIAFFQQRGLLHQQRICGNCGHEALLKDRATHGHIIKTWRCSNRACNSSKGLRSNTWFDPSKLEFHTILKFIYWWSQEVAANYVLQQQQNPIGGQNMTVEIDEALFTKRKSHQGRQLPEQWVFGGICRETRECFLVAVPDRTAATLLPIIAQRIAAGTTIHSDCWAAYNQIAAGGQFQHLRINHRLNFVDPQTGAHTQTIERLWRAAKHRNKEKSGTHRQMLDSYFCEFLWRHDCKRRHVDVFDEILQNIVQFMPPN